MFSITTCITINNTTFKSFMYVFYCSLLVFSICKSVFSGKWDHSVKMNQGYILYMPLGFVYSELKNGIVHDM